MKIKGSFTETQFRRAVKVAAKKGAEMQKEVLEKFYKVAKQCPHCLCHYAGFHTCDGMMKALVDYQKNKSTPRAMLTPEKLVKSKKKLSTKLSSKKCQQCRKPIPEDYWYCDSCANHPSVGGIMDFTVKTKEPPVPKGRTNPLSPDYPHY